MNHSLFKNFQLSRLLKPLRLWLTQAKVNRAGRHQDRVFKMTCDSLLNLDNRTIKSEVTDCSNHSLTSVDQFCWDRQWLSRLTKQESGLVATKGLPVITC